MLNLQEHLHLRARADDVVSILEVARAPDLQDAAALAPGDLHAVTRRQNRRQVRGDMELAFENAVALGVDAAHGVAEAAAPGDGALGVALEGGGRPRDVERSAAGA